MIDGVDGRVHHIEMDADRAENVSRGMIVVAGCAPPGPSPADRNILDIAGQDGVYRPSEHLERARAAIDRIGGDPEVFVRSHVRRLEALRRAGHAERIDAHWRVPTDLPARGQAYDLARDRANTGQIGHDGATWLDRVYRRVRHPMYSAFWLWAIAQALLLPNWIAGFAGLAGFAVLYFGRVAREERMMLETFGDSYRAYMARTCRVFPSVL